MHSGSVAEIGSTWPVQAIGPVSECSEDLLVITSSRSERGICSCFLWHGHSCPRKAPSETAQILVKLLKSQNSPQVSHSRREINFAKVSSRSPRICHNRIRSREQAKVVKRSDGSSDGRSDLHPTDQLLVRRILPLFSTTTSHPLPPSPRNPSRVGCPVLSFFWKGPESGAGLNSVSPGSPWKSGPSGPRSLVETRALAPALPVIVFLSC